MIRELLRRDAATAAAVALGYAVAGKLGLSLAVANASVTAIWPPTGIAIASILLVGPPAVIGVFVGAFLVNATTTGVAPGAFFIAVGNTLEGVVGAGLARRWAGGLSGFRSARGLLTISGLVVPCAAAISASIGVASLVWSGGPAMRQVGSLWWTWWLGDLTGGLICAPLVAHWATPVVASARRVHPVERLVFLVALLVSGAAVFGVAPPGGVAGTPIVFALLPVLTWAAFRMGPRDTATAVVILCGLAIAGTLTGRGPFAGAPADQPYLILQAFMAVMGVTALVMAALVGEHRELIEALRHRSGALEDRVMSQTADLMRTEAGSRRQAQILQLILDSIAEGVIVLDAGGRIIQFNPEARRIWGIQSGDVPGDHASLRRMTRGRTLCQDCATACPDDQMPLARALRGESVVEETYFLSGADGRPGLWVGKSARPLRDGDGKVIGAVALVRDITAERRAQELTRQKEVAEAASRAKSLFLATVSHELRTPLTAIIGFANLLLGGRVTSPEEGRRHLERVLENGRLLLEDIDDLLDLAKIEAGRMEIHPAPVDLDEFVHDVVGRMSWQARAKGLALRVEADPALPVIETDPAKLRRILGNLVGNALKFTERGEVLVRIKAEGPGAAIQVVDTGIGIPAGKLDEVFEAFQQVEQGGTRKYGGVGLGLAICRSLTELIGARLSVSSRVGEGSNFTVSLAEAPGKMAFHHA